jgi:hypothetical protein
VAFAANPAGSIPLAHGGLRVDGCGRFRFEHLNPPGSGLAALTVDDAGAVHALSAHFLPLVASEVIEQFGALAVKASTVQMWTDSAGSPFGLATFAEYGVLFATYRYHGSPAVGVTATRDGSPQPADDYYFSDTSEDSRGTIDPAQTSTGANGSALLVDSGLVTHSGTGGEIGGCAWTERLAATIAGVVAIAEFSCVP